MGKPTRFARLCAIASATRFQFCASTLLFASRSRRQLPHTPGQRRRLAVGGDERPAEGHPPRTRRPGAQRGGNLAPRRAGQALAADRMRRLRGRRGREPGRRRACDSGAGGKASSRGARGRMGGRQLHCLRTMSGSEVPGCRRSADGLRASPRLRQGPCRAAVSDDPRPDRRRDRAGVRA